MIQRRQFLCAATAAAMCISNRSIFASSTTSPASALSWNSKEIQMVRRGRVHRKPVVTGVSLQREGNLMAIVGDDHYVSLYDIRSQQFVQHLKEHVDWVRSAKFSPDSSALYTCGNDHRLVRWTTDELTTPDFRIERRDAIIQMDISNDSTKIATVGFCDTLIIHDAKDGSTIQKMKCSCNDNHAVAFSKDDQLVAAGGRCGTIRVWDLKAGNMVHEIKAHRRRIRSLEFTNAGELISASDDQRVRINKLNAPAQSIVLPRHASKLFAVQTMTPDVMATAGSDNKIHIWNTQRGSEIGSLEGHTGTVSCLDMAQGVLVSGSFDTTVRIWTPDQDELAVSSPKPNPKFVAPEVRGNSFANRPSSFKTKPKQVR